MNRNLNTLSLLFLSLIAIQATLTVQAQCFSELRAGASPEELAAEASLDDALILFERVVRLVEPALPPLIHNPNYDLLTGLEPNSAAYDSGVYLIQRGLLPSNFSSSNFTAATWRDMKNKLLAWYDLPALGLTALGSSEKLIQELASLSQQVGAQLEPVLIVASEDRRADTLSFLSLMHLQSPYPRLIILPPLENIDISNRIQTLFPLVSTCVFNIENYVYAPQATATRLFFSNTEAESYIVSSEPHNVAPLAIPIGQEIHYFQFNIPELAGVERFSVVFAGSNVDAMTVVRMLPQLRTNLGPRDIMRFFNQ